MLAIIMGIFFVLHGLVHLLYAGQSRRLFELRPKMVWPDGSWAFSQLLGDEIDKAAGKHFSGSGSPRFRGGRSGTGYPTAMVAPCYRVFCRFFHLTLLPFVGRKVAGVS